MVGWLVGQFIIFRDSLLSPVYKHLMYISDMIFFHQMMEFFHLLSLLNNINLFDMPFLAKSRYIFTPLIHNDVFESSK